MLASSCLLSQAILGTRFSLPSLVELLLIYCFLTVTSFVSESDYQLVLKRFIGLMIIPAVIVFVQYFYQKITGLSDPISMNSIFPKSVLLQGFSYDAHSPWNSTFQRPNGFFFLEPSIVSMFTASAAIIELTYFNRIRYAVLMIGGDRLQHGYHRHDNASDSISVSACPPNIASGSARRRRGFVGPLGCNRAERAASTAVAHR